MEDILMEYDYMRYLEATMDEQFDLEQYVLESVGVAFNESQRLEVFTEGVGEKIKNGWNKFKVWIKKVWAKFLEKLAHVFSNTKGYLEQYKDIILKKKQKSDYEVEIPNHQLGITRLFSKSVDVLQPAEIQALIERMKNAGKDTTNETDRIAKVNEYVTNLPTWQKLRNQFSDDSNVDFAQDNDVIKSNIKQYFLGGKARTIKTNDTSLNMTDMYEFCYHNEKIVSNIEKDKNSFEKTCDNITSIIETEAKKITDANTEKPDSVAKGTGDNKNSNTWLDQKAAKDANDAENAEQQQQAHTNSATNMTGDYITEKLDIKTSGSATSNSDSGNRTTAVDASSTANISKSGAEDDAYKSAGSGVGKEIDNATTSKENATAALNMLTNILKSYRDECVDVLVSKMNAAREISSNYMDLIRAHVQDYVGQPDKVADNTPVRAGTNYPKGNAPEKGPANNQK